MSHSLYSSCSVLLFGALSPSETKDPWPPSSLLFLSSLSLEQEQTKRGKWTEYSSLEPIDSIENTTQKKGWAPLLFPLFSLSQWTMSSGQWWTTGKGGRNAEWLPVFQSSPFWGAPLSWRRVLHCIGQRRGLRVHKGHLRVHLQVLSYLTPYLAPILPNIASMGKTKLNSTSPNPIEQFFFGTQNILQVLLVPMWMGDKSVDINTWASVYINNTQVSNLATGGAWPWSWQKYIGPEGTRHGWMRWMSYVCVWESMCMCVKKKPSWQK